MAYQRTFFETDYDVVIIFLVFYQGISTSWLRVRLLLKRWRRWAAGATPLLLIRLSWHIGTCVNLPRLKRTGIAIRAL
jgi:hypothetical protein